MTENAHGTHPSRRSILVRWDAAGNLGQLSTRDEHSGEVRSRFHLWTEDSRLHTVVDARHHSYYAYDHAGGSCGSRAQSQACLCYAEMQQSVRSKRLAARQGGGFGRSVLGGCPELADKATILFDQSLHQAPQLATPPEPHLLQEEHPDEVYDNLMKELFDLPEELVIHAEIKVDEFLQAMQNLAAADPEPDVYFYHSDHLGSASWITDADGTPVQHLQYLPYGEPYVNQRVGGYNERFTFTGKDSRKGWRIPLNKIKYNEQRDEETGYSYFGARYMDHELMTMWLSVDPLSDKYPSISPYAYCAWNPIRLVDPDGREIGDFVNEKGDVIGSDGKNDGKKYLLKMVRPTPRKTDSEADNSLFGISADKRKETEEFIRNNTGNESAFTDDCIAYENSILISTTKDEFAEMRSLCKDEDNALFKHEIGGLKCTDGKIYGGNDGTAPGIAIGTETNIQIKRKRELSYRYWFHLHLDDRSKYQMPSPADLKTFPDLIGYTISFRDRRIYVTTGGRCEGYITFGGTTKF